MATWWTITAVVLALGCGLLAYWIAAGIRENADDIDAQADEQERRR